MKSFKKMLALILSGIILFSIGCNSENTDKKNQTTSGFNATKEIAKLKEGELAAIILKAIEDGDLKKAAELGKAASKKEPKNVQVLLNTSLVYMYQEDYGKMEDVLRKAKTIAPNNPRVLNQLAWALINSPGKVNEGVNLARQSVTYFNTPELQKQISPYVDTYAYGLFKQGKYSDAIELWEKVLPNVQSGEIYIHLADAYLAKKDNVKAKEIYERALGFLELETKDANTIDIERQRLQRIEKKTKDSLSKLKTTKM